MDRFDYIYGLDNEVTFIVNVIWKVSSNCVFVHLKIWGYQGHWKNDGVQKSALELQKKGSGLAVSIQCPTCVNFVCAFSG